MSDGTKEGQPTPNWEAIATLAIQQRDRAEQKANNLEIELALVRQHLALLTPALQKGDNVTQLPPQGNKRK